MSQMDIDYYCARAIEERTRADECGEPNIANIHRELANNYDELAKLLRAGFVPDGFDGFPSFAGT